MSSRNSGSRALGRILDVGDIDLDEVALLEVVGGELLGAHKPLGDLAYLNESVEGYRVYLRDLGGDYLLILILEFFSYLTVLGLSYRLAEDMLALLGGDTADLFGLKLDLDYVACYGVLLEALSLLNGDVLIGVGDLAHDVLTHEHADLLILLVYLAKNDILIVVIPLYRRDYGSLYALEQSALGDVLLFAQQSDCLKKFAVIHFSDRSFR